MAPKKRKKMNSGQRLQAKRLRVTKEKRSWADLPTDALEIIFKKLGAFDIVSELQYVCTAWHNLSKQPYFYQNVKMHPPWYFEAKDEDVVAVEKEIITRSCGQLESLSMVIHHTEVLDHALNTPNSLKSLKLSRVLEDQVVKIVKKVPHLEKLELSLRDSGTWSHIIGVNDNKATRAIVEHIPHLRELRLEGYLMSEDGLQDLVKGLPCLESLNLEKCDCATYYQGQTITIGDHKIKTMKLPKLRRLG